MTGGLRTALRVAAAAGVGGATMASLGCAGASGDGGSGAGAASGATGTVLACAAGDIHHVFRIHEAAGAVDDESFTPSKRGVASVTPAAYRLQFNEPRDHYTLLVQVDRVTGSGTRQLFDDEQQVIKGHGGTDDLVCSPRAADD